MRLWISVLIILLVGGCTRGLTAEEVRDLVREEITAVAQGTEGLTGPQVENGE